MTTENVIETVMTEVAGTQTNESTKTVENETETNDGDAANEDQTKTGDEGANDEDNKPWPKKAKNALSKRDEQIKSLKWREKQRDQAEQQLKAELAQIKETLAKLNPTTTTKNAEDDDSDMPKETDYPSYHEYNIALHKYFSSKGGSEAAKKFVEAERKAQQEAQQIEQRNAWIQERSMGIKTTLENFMTKVPDAAAVLQEYGEWEVPDHLQQVFLEADPQDAINAFYNLAQAGKLEDLGRMSPIQAAIAISKASNPPAQQTTKAPAPMASAKGTNSFNSLATMSPEKLMEWLNSKG